MAQKRKQTPARQSASQTSYVVYGVIIVVTVFVVLAVARYYPAPSSDLPEELNGNPSLANAKPIVLPLEPVSITSEELRKETEEVVTNLIDDYPTVVVPHKIAAEFEMSTYRYEEAQSHWQAALKLRPQSIEAQTGLARVALEQGRPQEAVTRLEKLLQDDRSNVDLATQLARGLQQTGKLDEAAEVANRALTQFPREPTLLQTTAEIESQRGKLEASKELCLRGIEVNPSNGSLHFILSNVARRLGDVELADKHLEISRQLRPETKTGGGEFEKHYDESLRRIVGYTMAQAAEFYLDQGDAQQATQIALRAAEIYPQGGLIYRVLSKVLYRQERFQDAYQAERRLVAVEPNNPLNYVNLSKIAFLAGDPSGGRDALLAAYKRMPDSSTVATALAAYYLEEGDLKSAQKMAQESIQITPSVHAYQVLAAASAGLGDLQGKQQAEENARKLMQSSTRVAPISK